MYFYVIRGVNVREDMSHYLEHDLLELLERMTRRGFEYVDGMSGPVKRGRNNAGEGYGYVSILFRKTSPQGTPPPASPSSC